MTTRLDRVRATDDRALLPRIDTYYLRPGWTVKDLESPTTRGYLALRAFLRRLKHAG